MTFPVSVTFRDMHRSDSVAAHIRRKARKLDRLSHRILRCDVIVSMPHKHHVHGNRFGVHLTVSVPGEPIVVGRSAALHDADDLHVALERAFDDVERLLVERSERRWVRSRHPTRRAA